MVIGQDFAVCIRKNPEVFSWEVEMRSEGERIRNRTVFLVSVQVSETKPVGSRGLG